MPLAVFDCGWFFFVFFLQITFKEQNESSEMLLNITRQKQRNEFAGSRERFVFREQVWTEDSPLLHNTHSVCLCSGTSAA